MALGDGGKHDWWFMAVLCALWLALLIYILISSYICLA